jgi:hypothetical protein
MLAGGFPFMGDHTSGEIHMLFKTILGIVIGITTGAATTAAIIATDEAIRTVIRERVRNSKLARG